MEGNIKKKHDKKTRLKFNNVTWIIQNTETLQLSSIPPHQNPNPSQCPLYHNSNYTPLVINTLNPLPHPLFEPKERT